MSDSHDAQPAGPYAVELKRINKRFGAVWANKDIDLSVPKATIHGIIGENGAGKSTLMSVLYGFYEADSGDVVIDGEKVKMTNSTHAIAHGVGMVHQHFMLVETLSALENILLGAESSWSLDASKAKARQKLEAISQKFGLEVPLDEPVGELAVGVQQRVEILKALYRQAKILILDEPTGVLTPQEADQLFDVLRDLRTQGVTVLIITHKLREIMDVTDNVSVMRGGKMVAHRKTANTNAEELAELMVGRPVAKDLPKGNLDQSQVYLSVRDLSYTDGKGIKRLKSISFDLHAGEIVGLAGVSGNGQTELLKILSGEMRGTSGMIDFVADGKPAYTCQTWPNPKQLRAVGVAHIPEDRIGQGLLKNFTMQESAILGYHHDASLGSKFSLMVKKVRDSALALIKAFDVRPNLPEIRSANMSGGNQQKLIIAREMARQPKVLLVGQPTRGVDIGAIELIYKELVKARDAGAAILVVSVELDEVLTLSDRILVMNQGQITGELKGDEADPRTIGMLMASSEAMKG
ncbi:heme ABC transporter ATP-binding protein [Formosimonas limnophila]|uniref:Heme ABC transporter ATP-binding protein n=1 Tax=Formosimonas limnophila TaxID=1384487 RepID=A0A8J3G074_9BURK|nr:ABC transporter ATP-binding protein [Formosimonas limnophila]GHA70267.1 heme ABC transporter ATP-binding protein [Formosimonas limnophila]